MDIETVEPVAALLSRCVCLFISIELNVSPAYRSVPLEPIKAVSPSARLSSG